VISQAVFEPEDVFQMLLGPQQNQLKQHEDYGKWLESLKEGVGFTWRDDDAVLFSAGIKNIWQQVGEAWFVCDSCAIGKYISLVHRVCKWNIGRVFEQFDFRRIQAHVRADWVSARKFAEWLGFKQEGYMKKYGPEGADYIMYARVA